MLCTGRCSFGIGTPWEREHGTFIVILCGGALPFPYCHMPCRHTTRRTTLHSLHCNINCPIIGKLVGQGCHVDLKSVRLLFLEGMHFIDINLGGIKRQVCTPSSETAFLRLSCRIPLRRHPDELLHEVSNPTLISYLFSTTSTVHYPSTKFLLSSRLLREHVLSC